MNRPSKGLSIYRPLSRDSEAALLDVQDYATDIMEGFRPAPSPQRVVLLGREAARSILTAERANQIVEQAPYSAGDTLWISVRALRAQIAPWKDELILYAMLDNKGGILEKEITRLNRFANPSQQSLHRPSITVGYAALGAELSSIMDINIKLPENVELEPAVFTPVSEPAAFTAT